MKTRSLSPKHADSPKVPIIGMGTWKSLDTDDQDLVDGIVSAALAAGTTLIDSSPMYGKSERTLGRALAERLLPMAADLGLGVLIMRHLATGELLRTPPPPSALAPLERFGIHTWGQALLSWGLSHPATTVSIPATSRPARATENAAAGGGAELDDEHRQLIARLATA